MHGSAALQIALAVALGVGAQWLAARLRLPSIVFLLAAGFVAGPWLGLLRPDETLGDLLQPVIGIAVALILYEGGLSLRLSEIAGARGVVRNLVTVGALVTWGLATLLARAVLGLEWGLALMLGAVLVVTGPTVIGPLLQIVRPSGPSGPVLKWEGIVIDPIGALLAALVFEALLARASPGALAPAIAWAAIKTAAIGTGLGLAAAYALAWALRWRLVPETIEASLSLALVVAVYAASNAMQEEAGLFAATVMGIALANQRIADVRRIVEFKERLRVVLLGALFVALAARLTREELAGLGWEAALFVALLIVVVRPACALASCAGSSLRWPDRLFVAATGPRGIVAASVSAIFGLRLADAGYAGAERLAPLTFAVIIGTVLFHGLTARWVGRRLGVAEGEAQGLLLVGGSAFARALGKAATGLGVKAVVIDSNWGNVDAAAEAGLTTFQRDATDPDAAADTEMSGLGSMLALTANDLVNALAAQRFARALEPEHVYVLTPSGSAGRPKRALATDVGVRLFHPDATAAWIDQRLREGWTVREQPGDATPGAQWPNAIPLLAVSRKGRVRVARAEEPLAPKPDEVVLVLAAPEGAPAPGADRVQ